MNQVPSEELSIEPLEEEITKLSPIDGMLVVSKEEVLLCERTGLPSALTHSVCFG